MKKITEELRFADIYPEEAGKLAQKLHIKKEEIPLIRKYYISEKKKDEVSKKDRTIISRISCVDKDREGDSLLPDGCQLDNYRKNPIVCWGHSYQSPQTFIGKNLWIKKDDKGLIARTAFANTEFADQVFKAYTEDVGGAGPLLSGWSVGFIPLEVDEPTRKGGADEGPKRIFKSWELLEYSAVGIPASPSSLTLSIQKNIISSDKLIKDIAEENKIEIEITDSSDDSKIENFQEEIEIVGDTRIIKTMTPDELKDHYREKEVIEIEEDGDSIVTKPEVTENYIRIPVSEGHSGHELRTMTISASKGIKALYCIPCKKIKTYLFDVNKWTMAEAQAWVEKNKKLLGRYEAKIAKMFEKGRPIYKGRWNKSLSKLFNVEGVDAPTPPAFHFDLFGKFLECKIRDIFKNTYSIPCPLLGTYLAAFKAILGEFDLKSVRSFDYAGREIPPNYEVIQLNSEKSDDFLIEGIAFYDAGGQPVVLKYSPDWTGLNISLVTSNKNKEWNKDLLSKVHDWVYENNFLRGEKFVLTGEFLNEPKEDWKSLLLEPKFKDAIKKSIGQLEKKAKQMPGRGLLFIGPPGTGKTKTGRVMMTNLGSTFIWVSSRDFRKIGPLQAMALAFSLARDLAPSVLFIEDIDTWLEESKGRSSVIVDLIKTEMDGIRQNKGILTILTSNYPEKLPDALLDRPGRFHHIVNFELPNDEQRKKMLENWAGEIEEKLLDEIIEKTCGFSGAHIKELVEFAKIIAEEDEIEIGQALVKSLEKLMEQRELIEQIRENKKGLETSLRELFGMKKKELDIEEIEASEEESPEEEATILDGEGEEHELGIIEEVEEKAGEENLVPEETAFCECVKCGAKAPPTEGASCAKTKCPKCGGKMRTAKKEAREEEFECECVKCDHKMTSDKHCRDIKCPECGGKMRRASRPGPGKDFDETEHEPDDKADFKELQYMFKEIQDTVAELKEGRILSTKNRTLVKDIIDNISTLKEKLENLYNATEPTPRAEEEKEIEAEDEVIEIEGISEGKKVISLIEAVEKEPEKPKEEKEIDSKVAAEIVADALKNGLDPKFLAELTKSAVSDEFDRLRGIVKVEEGKE